MTMREKFEKQVIGDSLLSVYEADWAWNIWQAAYRAGQEEMREKIAAHIEKWEPDGKRIAATIRALKIDV